MAEKMIRIDLPVVLPHVADVRDECVERLVGLLERRAGVSSVHVIDGAAADAHAEVDADARAGEAQLCLHYEPELLTLHQVNALARAAGAEVTDRFRHLVIPFRRVGSEDDGRQLEAALLSLAGVTAASVNLAGQVARVEFDRRQVDAARISAALRDAGAEVLEEAPDRAGAVEPRPAWYARNRELAWSITSGVLMGLGWLLDRTASPNWIPILAYAGAYVFGARDNVAHTLKELRRGGFHFNIDFLMVVAAIGAAVLGEWFEGALLLVLFSLGHALEHYALGRAATRSALSPSWPRRPQSCGAMVATLGWRLVMSVAAIR